MYAREDIELDRSILERWVGEASALMAPLVEVLRRYVMSTDKLHGDDTPPHKRLAHRQKCPPVAQHLQRCAIEQF